MQILKYENERKIKEKFDFFKDDLGNENKKIEREVVKAIIENENLPIEIDEEFENQIVQKKEEIEEDEKKQSTNFRYSNTIL